jgi:hypothetical protein
MAILPGIYFFHSSGTIDREMLMTGNHVLPVEAGFSRQEILVCRHLTH